MVSFRLIPTLSVCVALACSMAARGESIPSDQRNAGQIYYGSPDSFSNPAEVNFNAALEKTPEYEEIRRKRIDSGTGRYWILMNDANNRVHRAIRQVGSSEGYDLIAEQGYLGNLDPAIASVDITDLVISAL